MGKLIVKRPWGQFEQFAKNEVVTVKVISVNAHSSLSLQYHKNRVEFWHILSGSPLVTIGGNTKVAEIGDEFMIPKLEKHRLEAKDKPVKVLEIG